MSKIKLNHSGGNAVSLNPPTDAPGSSDVAFKLPTTVGTAGQVLMSDGSGNLSWTDNTPMWLVKINTGSNDQTVATGTWTTLELTNEIFDTDNAFNTSTYTFTVPSSKAGKYWLYYQARVNSNPDDGENVQGRLDKNGSDLHISYRTSYSSKNNNSTWVYNSFVDELAAGDTLKLQLYHSEGGDVSVDATASFFGGYRLIGG